MNSSSFPEKSLLFQQLFQLSIDLNYDFCIDLIIAAELFLKMIFSFD